MTDKTLNLDDLRVAANGAKIPNFWYLRTPSRSDLEAVIRSEGGKEIRWCVNHDMQAFKDRSGWHCNDRVAVASPCSVEPRLILRLDDPIEQR